MATSDLHGMGLAVARLGTASRRAGRASFLVAVTHLAEGERVETVVQGRIMGTAGALILTADRVLAVNETEWQPLVATIPIAADLNVQGWEDDRSASLLLQTPATALTVDSIRDRLLAHEMAHRIRTMVADPARAAAASRPAVPAGEAPGDPPAVAQGAGTEDAAEAGPTETTSF